MADNSPPQSLKALIVARLLPDARGWCAIAIFAIAWRIFWMIDVNPRLLDSAPFMGVAGSLLGAGGLGLVLAFHFGSSSGTAKANERADKAEKTAASGGATTVSTPGSADVTVTAPPIVPADQLPAGPGDSP